MTLQTIADRLGVSRMTVSNAFSRPDQLSEELRRRILETAEELGYAGPDPAARALVRGTTGAVGVLLTDSLRYAFTDDVATGFLGAVVDELAPTGSALTLLTSDGHSGSTPARDVAIDGAIVYSCRPRSAAQDWLLRRGLPLVYVDQEPVPGITSVNVDDRGGARAAAQHLVDLGHRHVAIVILAPVDEAAGPAYPERERMRGWLDGLDTAGVEPTVATVARHTEDDAETAARPLLARRPRPTAVLCFSDLLALGVLRAAERSGLRVPADLSIVGFDDSPIARRSDPGLTTVRQDVAEKGRLAATALTETIRGARAGTAPQVRHHVVPTELVIRQSTAAPDRAASRPGS
ncbi:MAG TPA: LacI family DNA-binding transcriptional regulator [Acidimicrobiales bacterium]|nr:LacI family DNA-binding transcriptional regulator [Acidimicrobiales bacterium]